MRIWHRFTGESHGGLSWDDPIRAAQVLRELEGKRVEIAIRELSERRNLPQNALLHVLASSIAHQTGMTLAQVKARAVLSILGPEDGAEVVQWEGGRALIPKSTRELSKENCSRVIDWLQDLAVEVSAQVDLEKVTVL